MSDFWSEFDKPYRFFSQYCDPDDWHNILKAMAGAIVTYTKKPNHQIAVLDVGCGNGVATRTICELLYVDTGCFPSLAVVEPSRIAKSRLASNLLKRPDSGPLFVTASSLDDLSLDTKFDVIMFLHSTYYIDDFPQVVCRLVETHLDVRGVVCVLVLPERSPFFLDWPRLSNCSDGVESVLRANGLNVRSFVLRSRFRLPKTGELSSAEWEVLRRFVAPQIVGTREFRKRLMSFVNKDHWLDFGDHLLVALRGAI